MFFYIRLGFFAIGIKTIDTVRKLSLFVTVLGSGSAATANVFEVSEPRVESWKVMSCYSDSMAPWKGWNNSLARTTLSTTYRCFASLTNNLTLFFLIAISEKLNYQLSSHFSENMNNKIEQSLDPMLTRRRWQIQKIWKVQKRFNWSRWYQVLDKFYNTLLFT